MLSEQERSFQIIKINNNDPVLHFDTLKFKEIFSTAEPKNKLLVIGALGRMRVGKSSSLNNFYNILTGSDKRVFNEEESMESNTKGIHMFLIPFIKLTEAYQDKIKVKFNNEQVDIVLVDCEGTESSYTSSTSKLYLISLLINSIIHIHVSKVIDLNFATKLTEALTNSNKLVDILKMTEKELLPRLLVLIKDTTEKAGKMHRKRI